MRALIFTSLSALLLAGCHQQQEAYRADLANPDPIRRAQAVQGLAHGGDLDDLSYLAGRVGDPDPLVRAAVAEGLGHMDDRRSADALAQLAEDGNEAVQLQAVAALGRMKTPRAHNYLLLAYQRSGSVVRAKIAESLSAAGVSPAEAVEAEAHALYEKYTKDLSGSGAARLTAAEQLGHSGRPEAVERLVDYLGAESHLLAIAAARGLGASGAPEARPALEALLIEDDPDLQIAGAQALGALGDPGAGTALSRAIQRGGKAAAAALTSLLELSVGAPDTTPLICASALAPDPELAAKAGAAIHSRGLTCPIEPFLAKLRHGEGGGIESIGALAGLAEIWQVEKLPSAPVAQDADDDEGASASPFAKPVFELLKSGPVGARPFAARAASLLGLTSLLPDLTKARADAQAQIERARERWVKEELPQLFSAGFNDARSGPSASHAQVQALLGKLGVTAADETGKLPSLFSAPPASAVALWAEASLAEIRLGDEAGAARLGTLRSDPLPRVRLAAVEGVRWLPVSDQWTALTPLLDDPDGSVREAAVSMAGQLDPTVSAAGRWLLDQLQGSSAEPDLPLDAVVRALGHHPDAPGVTAALAAQLQQPEAAPAAIESLLAIGNPQAKAAILGALKAPRGIALDALLPAIGKLGDASAVGGCQPLLFHVQPEVRAAAVRALLAMDGAHGKAEVQVLAQDYDRRVRQAVAASTSLPR